MLKLYSKLDFLRELEPEPFENGLEPEDYRLDWRRDYARLIHSPSFRRLQGKTQLFPGVESDFFRNRLTHSIEVAQIAKSIAIRLNSTYNSLGQRKEKKTEKDFDISVDLVEFAGCAHDLGHPPFGHQGEEALDECMLEHGGFEGNAQTLRILSRLEKKFKIGFEGANDQRVGLNLCMRSLASVLKYDFIIPESKTDRETFANDKGQKKPEPVKGYYKCDELLVNKVKESVLHSSKKHPEIGKFKTIECSIMDIADDIAYSTYDLEDGFKAGFISPLDLLYPSFELESAVIEKVNKNLIKEGVDITIDANKMNDLIRENFFNFGEPESIQNIPVKLKGEHFLDLSNSIVDHHYKTAKLIAKDGSIRTGFTSSIVGRFVRGVELEYNAEIPALSKAKLTDEIRVLVEILKTFTYMSQITSPRLKIAEFRGKEIVTKIFNTLNTPEVGHKLMPDDIQKNYLSAKGSYQKRIICDYIASMTDKYAIEFYGRLTSENPETIFKPY